MPLDLGNNLQSKARYIQTQVYDLQDRTIVMKTSVKSQILKCWGFTEGMEDSSDLPNYIENWLANSYNLKKVPLSTLFLFIILAPLIIHGEPCWEIYLWLLWNHEIEKGFLILHAAKVTCNGKIGLFKYFLIYLLKPSIWDANLNPQQQNYNKSK